MPSALDRLCTVMTDPAIQDKIAIIDRDRHLTYRQLGARAQGLAAALEARGLAPGARIAVKLPNGIEYATCYLAGIFGGYTIVPINTSLPPDDIDYILRLTAPALIIDALDRLPSAVEQPLRGVRSDSATVFGIFFTSGTTSRPKGVCHLSETLLANAWAFNQHVGLDEATRMLHVMPMGYMAGVLNTILCPLMSGGTIVLGEQFSAAKALNFWKPAIAHGANAMWISPTMAALLTRLCRGAQLPAWTAASLEHVFVGTGPLPASVQAGFESTFGVRCLESYGLSELLLVSANMSAHTPVPGSVGPVLAGVEAQARDRDGHPLPPGATGSLFIKTDGAMVGYLDPDTGVLDPLASGAWFDTGDTGYQDEDGHLHITGRTKDMIIHGGMNVSPRAVEDVLMSHPHVRDVAVVGAPHPFWGEEVAAFIILEEGAVFDEHGLKEYCTARLGPDAVPTLLRVVERFPYSSTGKVQKNALRERL
jgi:acyl-CoA synthetase (AMP-forming)/AMP-acid ligase II